MKNNKNYKSADAALNSINQQLLAEEKVAVEGFEYKSFTEISKEFQNCKDVFAP